MRDAARAIGVIEQRAGGLVVDQVLASVALVPKAMSALVSASFLAAPECPLAGKMLDPALQAKFHRGRIYRHLCVPLGHHHMLDMRAHVPGIGLAGFFAWNPVEYPFGPGHVDLLEQVQPLMQQALAAPEAQAQWRSVSRGMPHLITSLSGQDHAELCLPVADGRLVCRATRTRFLHGEANQSGQMFVSLDLQTALEVTFVDRIMRLPLTRIQREIALFALKGGERSQCAEAFGVSPEALKKHLRAILMATGAANWSALRDWAEGETAPAA